MKYLIDTNTAIDFLDDKLPISGKQLLANVIDDACILSVVTKIELLRFDAPPNIYQTLSDFVHDSVIMSLDGAVVDRTIGVCKENRIKLPDGIIAATALVHNLILITRNMSDFRRVGDLQLINPWDI